MGTVITVMNMKGGVGKTGVITRSWHMPGAWIEHKSVADIKPIKATQDLAIETFVEGVDIIHRFYLCTAGRYLWDSFSSDAKKRLLAGLHGDEKKILKLDAA